MAENEGQEKTEEPTQRKLDKAREDGQVPRSKELNTTAILVFGAVGLLFTGPVLVDGIYKIAKHNFTIGREELFDASYMYAHLGDSLSEALIALAPWLVIVLFAAFLGPLGVGGWLFSTKAITPQLSRINPLSGLKRMFSMNSVVELLKAWAKVLVVGTVAYLVISFFFVDTMQLQKSSLKPAIADAVFILINSVIALCASTLLIAIADVPWQQYSHKKKLRMSLQDIKDEFKETEGKPEVKGKIKQLQREAAQRRMMGAVPEADVVITNPTHYAVALVYSGEGASAPVVVAKGVDQAAMKIREIAKENNVPQMEAPPLARAIYKHTRIDAEIPEGLYVAVAQVLAYIYQMDMYAKGMGAKPDRRPDMPIPEDLRVPADNN